MAAPVERIVLKAALNSPAPPRRGARRGCDWCASAAATRCRTAASLAAPWQPTKRLPRLHTMRTYLPRSRSGRHCPLRESRRPSGADPGQPL